MIQLHLQEVSPTHFSFNVPFEAQAAQNQTYFKNILRLKI